MTTNRRDFIKFVVAGSVAAGCPIDLSLLAAEAPLVPSVESEDNRICHQVRDGKIFDRPSVSARHDVVIVGGGVSGLTAAYLLRDRDFLLLEKEPHWGGNAYVMEHQGNAYATGSAFLAKSEYTYGFAKEIGLEPLPINDRDSTIIKGEWIANTWAEGLDKLPFSTSVREGFKKFKKDMLAIDVVKRAQELDNVPFSDFMKGYPAEVKQWWDNYGPSNWGAATEDTAAALGIGGMQDIGGDTVPEYYTWPGGLGVITKKLADILQPQFADHMQVGATTIAVVPDNSGVQVTYMQGAELKTVAAKTVIMATPKFITRRIVQGLPEKQSDAMHQVRYIPYVVVNLIFDKPVFNKSYDTWCPGNTFTDFIVADWTIRNQPGYQQKYNILTCYTPLNEEDRGSLLSEAGARKKAVSVLSDFQKLFPGSNVDPLEVHLYRRGHPLYMSAPGLYTKVQPLVRQPMDRVFFANTDSEGPESTTGKAIVAARRAVKEAESRMAGKPLPKHTAAAG
ncbi:MAG TPA: FAD-dependent oxidoreductase [Terriglobales bacterium]|jgi:oxygen-dependent protoporphyrinogen oxidase|nr:FAD-dependent oxidoreductase [Terriglobales bacterium]